jgi:hypothetical protein
VHQNVGCVTFPFTNVSSVASRFPNATDPVAVTLQVPTTVAVTGTVVVAAHAAPLTASTASAMKTTMLFFMISSPSFPRPVPVNIISTTRFGLFRKKP